MQTNYKLLGLVLLLLGSTLAVSFAPSVANAIADISLEPGSLEPIGQAESLYTDTPSLPKRQLPLHLDYSRKLVIGLPELSSSQRSTQQAAAALRRYLISYWQQWGRSFNYQLSFKLIPVEQAFAALSKQRVDIIATSFYSPAKHTQNLFSIPYINSTSVLYRRAGELPARPKLGVHQLIEQQLPTDLERYYSVEVIEDLALAVEQQRFDLLYSNAPALLESILHQHNMSGDYQPIPAPAYDNALRAAVLPERRELMLDINTGIRTLPVHFIDQAWQQSMGQQNGQFSPISGSYLPQLSLAKQHFIIDHPVLEYGIVGKGWQPYTINQQGMIDGYVVDILELIGSKTGLHFVPREIASFGAAMQAVKGGSLDLLPNVYKTRERLEQLQFSVAYDDAQPAIVSLQGFDQLADLAQAKLAVIRGYHESELIRQLLPQAELQVFENPSAAVQAVRQGQVDAYVGNYLVNSLLVNSQEGSELEVEPIAPFSEALLLRFATGNKMTQLVSLLDMGLNSLGEQQLAELRQSWVERFNNQQVEQQIDQIYQRLSVAGAALAGVLLLVFLLYQQQQRKRRQTERTIRQALDQAQQAKAQAELSAKAKTDFLARMSHEIRTPMNGVLGMAEALSCTQLSHEQQDLLGTLNGSARNLMALLNDVLDFSKMDADKLSLEHIPLNLSSLVQGVVDNYRHRAKHQQLSLHYQLDPQLSDIYLGDPTRLAQVLNNLVSNALKFTQHGFVEIQLSCLEKGSEGEADRILFAVRDSGIGIAPDKLASLFDPFVQAEGDTTRKFGGSGLGLSICKEIIATMASEIQVQSIQDMGSLFSFELQLQAQTQPEFDLANPLLELPLQYDLSQLRVLFAEDNAVNRKVIQGQLRRLGIEADVAENGLQALQMHQQQRYDLVLSDCHMPEMDGYSLAEQLSAEENSPYLIAITADALSGAAEKCLAAGFNDYISKPCPIDVLESKLQQTAERLGCSLYAHDFACAEERFLATQAEIDALEQIDSKLAAEEIYQDLQQTWQQKDATQLESPSPCSGTAEQAKLNHAHLMEMCGDDPLLAEEILQVFVERSQVDIDELQQVLSQGCGTQLKNLAHRIKGSLRYLGAEQLAELAAYFEQQGQAGRAVPEASAQQLIYGIQQLSQAAKQWLAAQREQDQ
jgi:signal transduction histidine kinase/DNA-binding NarL/FixJ family response regulator/HPt (histidine-containing phosphotransfer) domain-containing protein